jgi:uncharacterized protein (DUF433 family)
MPSSAGVLPSLLPAVGRLRPRGLKKTRTLGTCGGEIVFKGTRVTSRTVLASPAEGNSFDQILEDYPSLTQDHLRAAIAFAAASTKEDLPTQVTPVVG